MKFSELGTFVWITGSRTGKAALRAGRYGPVMTKLDWTAGDEGLMHRRMTRARAGA